jgi:phage gp16-like protein
MNRNQLAIIHIAKKQVAMTDEEYRDLLGSVGVESSKNLNNKTFSIVINHFEQLGFKTKSKTRAKRKVNNLPNRKQPLMKKLEAIILDMDKSWAYVDSIAKSRFNVETTQWLEVQELQKLVQMMVIYQKRQQKKEMRRMVK